ncbi:MAG: iron ABC transporter permease [Acidimicrobiales bacterium]
MSLAIGVLFAGPLAYVAWSNIRLGSDLTTLLRSGRTLEPLGRSVLLATAVSATSTVAGTVLAWTIHRTDLVGRRVWAVLAPLPLVFPSFVGATALISGFATGGLVERITDPIGLGPLPPLAGFSGAWLVLTIFTYPYVYLPVAARLRRLPTSLEESARLLGRRPIGVFTSIVLPQTASAMSAGTLLVFLYTISDFGAVQLLRYDTLTRAIFTNQLADRATSMAMALILGAVALAVVAAERRLVRSTPATSSRAGSGGLRYPLGPWRAPVTATVVVFFAATLVGPIASLLHWLIRGLQRQRTTGATAVDVDGLATAVTNTVTVSVVAAIATVLAVLPIAYLTARHRSRIGSVANALVVAGFALPGIVIALAIIFWVLNAPLLARFYQTLPLLVLAYVIHFGAQATRASAVAVASVPEVLDEAARMLAAGRWRRLATIDLPLMAPGLLAAGGLVLLSTMKELPATLLLSPTGYDTVATRIWASMETVSYAQAGLDSLVLLAVSAVLTWLLVIRSSDRFD